MAGLLRKVAPGARIHDAGAAASLGLVGLFLIDEDSGTLRDLVSGTSKALSSGTVSRGEAGPVLKFNGSQGINMPLRLPENAGGGGNHGANIARFSILGRLRPDANAASDPAAIFGAYAASGTQNGLGVGWNGSSQVGFQWLSGSGAATSARSPGGIGTWRTVYASASENGSNYAWIDGQPATTSQGQLPSGGAGAVLNEVSFGAQHRSAGFLRNANGALEWAAVLYGAPLNDAAAWYLYASDFPYSILTPRRRYWRVPAPGGGGGTLAVDAASLAWTGHDVGLRAGRRLTLDTASLAWTGQDVGLRAGRRIAIDTASLAFTGQDVGLRAGRRIALDAAALTWTGQPVGLRSARRITLDTAPLSWTGQGIGLRAGRRVALDTAALSWTAYPVGLTFQSPGSATLAFDTASLSWTGHDIGLRAGRRITVDTAPLSWTGHDIGLRAGRRLTLDTASLAWTPHAIGMAFTPSGSVTMVIETASLAWTGHDISMRITGYLAIDRRRTVALARRVPVALSRPVNPTF